MEQFFGADADILGQYVIPWGVNIGTALLIYVVGRWIIKFVVRSLKTLMDKSKIDDSLGIFLSNIINAVLTVFIVIAALDQLGVDTTSIMAIFAAAGLAVGLALKDSLSNFSSGVMLILFKPFKVGDVINAAGVTGTVEAIQVFNTILRTGDNQEVIAPNSHVYGGIITNLTAKETRRIDLVIGIGYEDSIVRAKETLEDILSRIPYILNDPKPAIMVLELGESSIDLAVRPWVKTGDYWGVRSELLQMIKEEFDKQSISIPYPQRDLHVFNINEQKLTA